MKATIRATAEAALGAVTASRFKSKAIAAAFVIAAVVSLPSTTQAATLDDNSVLSILAGVLKTFSQILDEFPPSTTVVAQNVAGNGNPSLPYAAASAIDQLSDVTISNSTIDSSSIPDLSGKYLSLGGGTVSGNLTVTGTLDVPSLIASSTSYISFMSINATSTNFFATYASTTNATSTNIFSSLANFTTVIANTFNAPVANIVGLTATNATTTNLAVTGTGYFAGNVGIGTTTPQSKLFLAVPSSINADDGMTVGRSGGSFSYLKFGLKSDSSGSYRGAITASNGTTPTEIFSVPFTTFNVGIGTTTPPQQLSVANNVYVGGYIGVGQLHPNALLFVGNGTGSLTNFSNSGVNAKIDSSASSVPAGGEFNLNVVSGSANGLAIGSISRVDVNDVSSTGDAVGLWGDIFVNTASARATWGANIYNNIGANSGYTGAAIGAEIGLKNNILGNTNEGGVLHLVSHGAGFDTFGAFIDGNLVNELMLSDNGGAASSTNAIYFGTTGADNVVTGTPKFIVTEPGNVGIDANPLSSLDVGGNVAIGTYAGSAAAPTDGLIVSGSAAIGTTTTTATLNLYTGPQWGSTNYGANLVVGGTRNNAIGILSSSNGSPWAIGNASGDLRFVTMPSLGNTTTAPTTRVAFTASGNVGIGTTSPTTALQVNGVITPNADNTSSLGNATYRWSAVYSANGTIQTSDERLKSNITDIGYGLSDLLKLRPVSFTWIAQPQQGTQLGFIAQDVQPIFPEIVNVGDDPNHTLGLTYTEFIPVIVKSIQQLAQQVADLADAFTSKTITATNELCVNKSDGTPVCVTGDQLAAVLASDNQTPSSESSSPSQGYDASTTADTPPVIQINGDNPAYINLGDTYNDLGATITGPRADLNLGIKTFFNGQLTSNIVLDTSAAATDTIDYVATDQSGLAATSTRTVIILAATTTPASP